MTVPVIVLWLWRGWRPIYDRRDVMAVATMLRERGGHTGRIVLLTDQGGDWHRESARYAALDIEEAGLWPDVVGHQPSNRPNCYRRLKLFDYSEQVRLALPAGHPVVSMDLDSVIMGPLSGLWQAMEPDDVGRYQTTFAAMGGLASRIHGSLFAFIAGTHGDIWSRFHPVLSPIECSTPMRDGTPRPIGSDQAWLSRRISGEVLWQRAHGCYSWNRHGLYYSPRHTGNQRYWSFAGHTKPRSDIVRQVRPDLFDTYTDAYGRS